MKKVKVSHPKFGHVIFTNPTPRQEEVLEVFQHYMEGLLEVKDRILLELYGKRK